MMIKALFDSLQCLTTVYFNFGLTLMLLAMFMQRFFIP